MSRTFGEPAGRAALVALSVAVPPAGARPARHLPVDSRLAAVRGDRPASPATALIAGTPESVDATRSRIRVRTDNWFSGEGGGNLGAR